jgi:hypothetical protein
MESHQFVDVHADQHACMRCYTHISWMFSTYPTRLITIMFCISRWIYINVKAAFANAI